MTHLFVVYRLSKFIYLHILTLFIRWVLQKHPIIGEPVHLPPLPDSNDELRSMTVVPYLDDLYNPTESDDDRSYEDRSLDDRSYGDQVGDQQSQGKMNEKEPICFKIVEFF